MAFNELILTYNSNPSPNPYTVFECTVGPEGESVVEQALREMSQAEVAEAKAEQQRRMREPEPEQERRDQERQERRRKRKRELFPNGEESLYDFLMCGGGSGGVSGVGVAVGQDNTAGNDIV